MSKSKVVTAEPDAEVESSSSGGSREANPAKKRKAIVQDGEELEIDVSAPEPLSKKSLRKAKKQKLDPSEGHTGAANSIKDTDEVPSNGIEPAQSKDNSAKRSDYGIWIGNLPFAVNKAQLKDFLLQHGGGVLKEDEITRIHIPAPSNPQASRTSLKPKNKGFAYIDFNSEIALNAALLISETSFGGRKVLIKNAKSFEGRPTKADDNAPVKATNGVSRPTANTSQTKRIFVGNLSFDVTREDLQTHFLQCGPIAHNHMATFEDSGKCKGYAWITFEEAAAAEAAVRGYVLKMPDADSIEAGGLDDAADDKPADGEELAEPKRARKTPKPRKWFVNKLFGRALRCEFAEDPSTRYKKRFGKQPQDTDEGNPVSDATPKETQKRDRKRAPKGTGQEDAFAGIKPGAPTDASKRRGKTADGVSRNHEPKLPDESTYRTGAVVTPTGTKTSFD